MTDWLPLPLEPLPRPIPTAFHPPAPRTCTNRWWSVPRSLTNRKDTMPITPLTTTEGATIDPASVLDEDQLARAISLNIARQVLISGFKGISDRTGEELIDLADYITSGHRIERYQFQDDSVLLVRHDTERWQAVAYDDNTLYTVADSSDDKGVKE